MQRSFEFRRLLLRRVLLAMGAAMGGLACSSATTEGGGNWTSRNEPIDCVTFGSFDGGMPDAGPNQCPTRDQARQILKDICSEHPIDVTDGPDTSQGECCYTAVWSPCSYGRPFVVDGLPRVPVARTGRSARPRSRTGKGRLPTDLRRRLGAFWLRAALLEHASVASFAKFSLDLLAVGAPPSLVAEAHQAAIDELRHAELCFDLAARYGESAPVAAPFRFGPRVAVASDLSGLASETVRDGCVGETCAAAVAQEQLRDAKDATVRAVLARIAADESRHAELAWRTVAWAIGVGGDRVRRAVRSAFAAAAGEAEALAPDPEGSGGDADLRLAAHGFIGNGRSRAASRLAWRAIVSPARNALGA
jgi:hypothetical protein